MYVCISKAFRLHPSENCKMQPFKNFFLLSLNVIWKQLSGKDQPLLHLPFCQFFPTFRAPGQSLATSKQKDFGLS